MSNTFFSIYRQKRRRILFNFEGCRMVESNTENKWKHAFWNGQFACAFNCLQGKILYRVLFFSPMSIKKKWCAEADKNKYKY